MVDFAHRARLNQRGIGAQRRAHGGNKRHIVGAQVGNQLCFGIQRINRVNDEIGVSAQQVGNGFGVDERLDGFGFAGGIDVLNACIGDLGFGLSDG